MIRVDTVFTGLPGLPGYNSQYFEGVDTVDAEVACEAVKDFWAAIAAGNLVDDLSISVLAEVPVIDSANGEILDFLTGSGGTVSGGATTDALPSATQMCLNLSTAGVVAGRRVRGRIFVPGYNEASNNPDGTPGAGARSGLSSAYVSQVLPAQPVIWSRPIEGGRAGSSHAVTAASTKATWAVLRSRRD